MRIAGAGTRVALVLALAGLIALGSQHGHIWDLPLRAGSVDRTRILIAIGLLTALALVVAAAVTTLVHSTVIARRPGSPPLRDTLLRALPITATALAVLGLLMVGRADPGSAVNGGGPHGSGAVPESSDRRGVPLSIDWWTTNVRASEGEDREDAGGAGDRRTPFPPLVVMVGAVVAALAGFAAWRSYGRRRRDDYGPADETRQEAVHGALVDIIDAMLADPDPNTAIRGAYARLLEGLDALGAGRRDHEAPLEHVRRVFAVLDVRPEPVRRLTELFEVARFSTHPLSSAHRDQALRSLRDVAADLESGPAFRRRNASARPGRPGGRPLTGSLAGPA